jgi:hypothetical protein
LAALVSAGSRLFIRPRSPQISVSKSKLPRNAGTPWIRGFRCSTTAVFTDAAASQCRTCRGQFKAAAAPAAAPSAS